MTIKNIGAKIISVGTTVLMPGDEMPASKEAACTPAIKAMERKGFLSVTGDEPAARPSRESAGKDSGKAKAAQAAAEQEAREAEEQERNARAAADGPTPDAAEDVLKDKAKAIKKLNRGELDQACIAAGIEVAEGDTIPTLQEKLIANLQNQQ